ncbi:PadR family transcriptional regulator [Sphingomonas koreensis]|nr:PadR family transcriptional regulator [Sphingomonas koreensis]
MRIFVDVGRDGRGGRHGCGPRGQHAGPGKRFGFAGGYGREHGFGGRHGGRSRRMFDGGELRLVLLKLIADQPRHGYDLIRQIEELTGGAYAPSPGVIYPTITLLDDMELIEERHSEGAKKLFAITAAGTAYLEKHQEQVEALMARLAEVGAERARSDNGSIRRALGNLRAVLNNRMYSEELDEETIHAIVAEIDAAAQKIERL